MLKIAVLAPMPSASVSTATAVKPGFFSNWRKANLRSFITQRHHRIGPRGSSGWNEAGQQRHDQQQQRNHHERDGIHRTDSKQQAAQQSSGGKRSGQADQR